MIKTPAAIESKMEEWRAGFAPFPTEYCDFHEECAERDIKLQGWVPIRKALVDDGWGDGMKVVQIELVDAGAESYRRITLKWHTSGAWFLKHVSGGSTRHVEMLLDGPGYTTEIKAKWDRCYGYNI